jgi:hypothetical protein
MLLVFNHLKRIWEPASKENTGDTENFDFVWESVSLPLRFYRFLKSKFPPVHDISILLFGALKVLFSSPPF